MSNDPPKTITVRVSEELLAKIDAACQGTPREAWMREAFRSYMAPKNASRHVPGPDVTNIRSTEQIRRDIRPLPKDKDKGK